MGGDELLQDGSWEGGINQVEVQRKVGFAGSANIEHTRDLMFT